MKNLCPCVQLGWLFWDYRVQRMTKKKYPVFWMTHFALAQGIQSCLAIFVGTGREVTAFSPFKMNTSRHLLAVRLLILYWILCRCHEHYKKIKRENTKCIQGNGHRMFHQNLVALWLKTKALQDWLIAFTDVHTLLPLAQTNQSSWHEMFSVTKRAKSQWWAVKVRTGGKRW